MNSQKCIRCNKTVNSLQELHSCNECGLQLSILNKLPQREEVSSAIQSQLDFNNLYHEVSSRIVEIKKEQEKTTDNLDVVERDVLELDGKVNASIDAIEDLKTKSTSKSQHILSLKEQIATTKEDIVRQYKYMLSNEGLIKPLTSHNYSNKWTLVFSNDTLQLLMNKVSKQYENLSITNIKQRFEPDVLLSLHSEEVPESILRGVCALVPTLGKWELSKVSNEGFLWELNLNKVFMQDKKGLYLNASIMHNEGNSDIYLEYINFPWKFK